MQPKTESSKILNQEKCRPIFGFLLEAVVMDYYYLLMANLGISLLKVP